VKAEFFEELWLRNAVNVKDGGEIRAGERRVSKANSAFKGNCVLIDALNNRRPGKNLFAWNSQIALEEKLLEEDQIGSQLERDMGSIEAEAKVTEASGRSAQHRVQFFLLSGEEGDGLGKLGNFFGRRNRGHPPQNFLGKVDAILLDSLGDQVLLLLQSSLSKFLGPLFKSLLLSLRNF